jgi:hypothetical protein
MCKMDDLIERVKTKWVSEGVAIRSGVSEERIALFERSHGVELPDEMRHYFRSIDGMGPEFLFTSDLRFFWNFDDLYCCAERITSQQLSEYPWIAGCYVFGTESLGVPDFFVNLSKGVDHGRIGELFRGQEEVRIFYICDSLSVFFELYLLGEVP